MEKRKTIFAIDDSEMYLAELRELLMDSYNVLTISSGEKCFALHGKVTPDLILLDVEMPEMDGFEVLATLKSGKYEDYTHVPVIFLTGMDDFGIEAHGLEMGAVDFINKPFSESVLRNRIKLHIDVSALIFEQTKQLRTAHAELEKIHESIIFVLANAVENRDYFTGGHIERTMKYVTQLIKEMLERDVYTDELRYWDLDKVAVSALLHDVGKLGISDIILNKPGKLTVDEFERIKIHSLKGAEIIDDMLSFTKENKFLHNAKLFALYHHESWDGSGYPYGLKGEAIPLQGRILAIADVWDALISERPYKRPYPFDKAVEIMREEIGKRLDPQIATVFLDAMHEGEIISS